MNNLQIAVKNNIDIYYFAIIVPLNLYFDDNGQMDKRDFLQLWKDIPVIRLFPLTELNMYFGFLLFRNKMKFNLQFKTLKVIRRVRLNPLTLLILIIV